ncbi:CG1231 [Drosophila busckii]|uniref:CG1231 n=1 Tax=Drosophila busckii TaxID=30019 RepID=A0A0M4E832_DROBS|nr:uncharacterized protein LOC108598685 [Drosophila busckii]ALC38101.1 CG1231 [Drosophila busckii]
MLARHLPMNQRGAPSVHERIALQCARNISQLAIALPKPRTQTGHLPVLVEVRRPDEDIVYRYQVNLWPSAQDRNNQQQIHADEARALSQFLNLPCLLHHEPLAPAAELPQLVMMQESLHFVHHRQSQQEAITTLNYMPSAIAAKKATRDHFMAVLHQQQPSPLAHQVLWANSKPATRHKRQASTQQAAVGPPRISLKQSAEQQLMVAAHRERLSNWQAHLPQVADYSEYLLLQRELAQRQQQQAQQLEQQKYERILKESLDSTQLPLELQALFAWESCSLCHTTMRTMRNALDHYLSRAHLRRVDSWLIRCSFVKDQLSDKMMRHLRSTGPAVLHCDLCDLKLTSVVHARQHFCGRRHRLVERQVIQPNGEGYYDRSGRWVRTNDKWLMCQLCDVIVTSESQLSLHRAGLRHRKRERSALPHTPCGPYDGSYVYRVTSHGLLEPLNPAGYYLGAVAATQDVRRLSDLNAAFYCEVCNITLNHLKSVKQHEAGRVHNKRLGRLTQQAAGYMS